MRGFKNAPQLRLHARLSWRWPTLLWAVVPALVALSSWISPLRIYGRVTGGPWILTQMLVLAPASALLATRLTFFERDGRLDQLRLFGRPPALSLFTSLVGTLGPATGLLFAIGAGLALIGRGVRWYFALAVTTAAVLYAVCVAVASLARRTIVMLGLALGALGAFPFWGAHLLQRAAFDGRYVIPPAMLTGLLSLSLVFAVLAVFESTQRFRRPAEPRPRIDRIRRIVLARTRRLLGLGGPEFRRALAAALFTMWPIGLLWSPALAVLSWQEATEPWAAPRGFLALCHLLPLLILPSAVEDFVRRERHSGLLDLVRVTPQRPLQVGISWTAGSTLPWLVSLFGPIPIVLGLRVWGESAVQAFSPSWGPKLLAGLDTVWLVPLWIEFLLVSGVLVAAAVHVMRAVRPQAAP